MCKVEMQVKRRRIDKVDRAVHYVIFLGPTGSLAFTLSVIGMGKWVSHHFGMKCCPYQLISTLSTLSISVIHSCVSLQKRLHNL